MLRASLAALAALLLVGVLSALIVESRAVKADYYAAHADRMRAIETSRDDLTAVIDGTQAALEEGRQVSTSTHLAFTRLSQSNTVLQSPDERLRIARRMLRLALSASPACPERGTDEPAEYWLGRGAGA